MIPVATGQTAHGFLAAQGIGRQPQALLQIVLRLLRVALGQRGGGQSVIHRRYPGELPDALFVGITSFVQPSAVPVQLGQSKHRPGHRTLGNQVPQHAFLFPMLTQPAEGHDQVALALGAVARVCGDHLPAGLQHTGMVALVVGFQYRAQGSLHGDQAIQPLLQAGLIERLGQVAVRFAFQRSQHHGLTALGGDHHEHAVGWKQAPVMEFLQDLLTVLAAAQVIVVQDHVILIASTQGQGFLAAAHRVDVVHTHLPQHAGQG